MDKMEFCVLIKQMSKEINMRICNAWKSTHSLYSLLRSKLLRRALKIELYHSVIYTILTAQKCLHARGGSKVLLGIFKNINIKNIKRKLKLR